MTLKIETDSDGRETVIRLSGRLRSEHLDELQTQIKSSQSPVVFDLEGVMLFDVEAVRFFNTCQEKGIELLHCPPYVREWMLREQDGKN